MIHVHDKDRYAIQFDNLLEMVQWARETPRAWSQNSSHERGSRSWAGTETYEEAERLASEGWPEGIKEIHALSALVPSVAKATRRYGVAGSRPIVARALGGNPKCMVRRGRDTTPKPTMTLVVGIGGTAGVSAKEMANFGAAITALVDRLESRKIRVQLLAHWGNRMSARTCSRWGLTWTVKNAEDALDLNAVAYSLGHASAMRRLGFAVMERTPKSVESFGYGGTLSNIDKGLIVDLPEDAICFGGVEGSRGACRTLEGAVKYAQDSINQAAGEPIAELEVEAA